MKLSRGDHAHGAEVAALAELAHAGHRPVEAVAVADDQIAPCARAGLDHGRAIVERDRHRFLEKHMLAVRERKRGVTRVELMRRRDVDDVDLVVRAQALDIVERGSAEVSRELLPCGRERIGAGDDPYPRIRRERRQHQRECASEPRDADTDRSAHRKSRILDIDRKSRYVRMRC